MSDDEIRKVLDEWADELDIKGFGWDVLRDLLWALIKGLAAVCDYLNDAIVQIYGLLGFANSGPVRTYIENMHFIVVILLTVSVCFLGYFMIFKRANAKINVLQNLLLIGLIITCMPIATVKMADLTTSSSDYVRNQYQTGGSAAFAIIDNNIVDMLYIDNLTSDGSFSSHAAAETADGSAVNRIADPEKLKRIDINAYMDYEDSASEIVHKELFKSRIVENADGTYGIGAMDKSFFDFMKDYYYRYEVRWGIIFFSLLSLAAILLFTCIKAGRIVWEVVAHNVLGPLIAVTDLAGGQRIREFLKSFVALFAVLFLIVSLLGVYFLGLQYISSLYAGGAINSFVYVILQITLALFVIDGPNLIERIIGIDAGIKSGWGVAVGAYALARGAKGIATGARNFAVGDNAKRRPAGKPGHGGVLGVGEKAVKVAVGNKGIGRAKEKFGAVGRRMYGVTGGEGLYGAAKTGVGEILDANDARMSGKMDADNVGGQGLRTRHGRHRDAESDAASPGVDYGAVSAGRSGKFADSGGGVRRISDDPVRKRSPVAGKRGFAAPVRGGGEASGAVARAKSTTRQDGRSGAFAGRVGAKSAPAAPKKKGT